MSVGMCREEGQGLCECVFERVTHALSIKRIEGDQVARQLRAAIVCGDNGGPQSALSSFSPHLFLHLSFTHTHYACTFCLTSPPPLPPASLSPRLGAWAGTRR